MHSSRRSKNMHGSFLSKFGLAGLALFVAAGYAFVEYLAKPARGVEEQSTEVSADRRAPIENPKVQPGKVSWHAGFADACAASNKSGKPVLLFQMMGKLDERFC